MSVTCLNAMNQSTSTMISPLPTKSCPTKNMSSHSYAARLVPLAPSIWRLTLTAKVKRLRGISSKPSTSPRKLPFTAYHSAKLPPTPSNKPSPIPATSIWRLSMPNKPAAFSIAWWVIVCRGYCGSGCGVACLLDASNPSPSASWSSVSARFWRLCPKNTGPLKPTCSNKKPTPIPSALV